LRRFAALSDAEETALAKNAAPCALEKEALRSLASMKNPHEVDERGRHDEHRCLHCWLHPPQIVCRIHKRSFTMPGAGLAWHANAQGRAECPWCNN